MTNHANDARNSSERGETIDPRLITATHEVAEAEIRRAGLSSNLSDLVGDQIVNLDNHRHVPGKISAAIGHFLLNPQIHNTTLSSLYLEGDWNAADQAENEINEASIFFDVQGYHYRIIPRKAGSAANIVLKVVPEQTQEPDFVAWHRIRQFGRATLDTTKFVVRKDPRAVLKIEKHSWGVIDIAKLEHESPEAAKEVNLIIAANLLKNCRLDFVALEAAYDIKALSTEWLGRFLARNAGDYERQLLDAVLEKVNKTNLPDDMLFDRLFKYGPQRMYVAWSPITIDALEIGIRDRYDYVTPAVNTYNLSTTEHTNSVAEQWNTRAK